MEKWGIEKSRLTIIWQFEECGSILVKVVKEICQNRDGQIKIDGHLEDTFVQKIYHELSYKQRLSLMRAEMNQAIVYTTYWILSVLLLRSVIPPLKRLNIFWNVSG